ncbi:AAA family ATPase [Zafaria sp. Z1313]|uniref:AAA family ATPase n=1 Tax=Zafaria sp. Z1313 TaxID=3423202 RepID=UPI003D303D90
MTVSVALWADELGLGDRIEALRGRVTVVRRTDELAEIAALAESGLADAALLAGPASEVEAPLVDALTGLGATVVVLVDDDGERARLAGLGAHCLPVEADEHAVTELLEQEAGRGPGPVAAAGHRPGDRDGARAERPKGRVVAVWGPTGSPGRTTVAVNFAVESAQAGRSVLLVDADTYGASAGVHLGLLDESAGAAQLCRLADQGVLDAAGFERACPVVAVAGTRLRIATGLPRAQRWPELRAAALGRVLDFARRQVDLVVVDTSAYLELDEDLSFDTAAPQRNGAALAVLEAADEVVAVGQADSVGVPRLIKALEALQEVLPTVRPNIVFNKVKGAALGRKPERQLRETWERFGPGLPITGWLPWDPDAVDAALLAGSALAESFPDSRLRAAIAGLAGHGVQRRVGAFRR